MKVHVGMDATRGLVHTGGVTAGSVHDAKLMDSLLREDDRAVYGDRGYASEKRKRAACRAGVLWAVKAFAVSAAYIEGYVLSHRESMTDLPDQRNPPSGTER